MTYPVVRPFTRRDSATPDTHRLRAGFSRARVPLLAMLLAAVAVTQGNTTSSATVHRDVHGMPHIVADNEATAWYALGYEQARDALLWIQYACKAGKGEMCWVRGADDFAVANDFAVQVFNAHGRLAAMTDLQRHAFFASTNPAILGNFWSNCVAFAAGANAYRLLVQYAPASPVTPERKLRDWLDANTIGTRPLTWVYQQAIQPVDIAAQGAWSSAGMSFMWPSGLVNSSGGSYGDLPAGSADVDLAPGGDPLASGHAQRWLDQWRQQLASLPGAPSAFLGSNTFAWSRLYCRDATPGTTTYAGLLGDPHQGAGYRANAAPGFYLPNHLWFAHVKVTPSGSSQPILDVLGHFPHASAAPFTCHNRNVAMGGTQGAPNHFDTFLLRLEEGTSGAYAQPVRFYSHYHDPTNTNVAWRGVSEHWVTIKQHNTPDVSVRYWRAESYGVILPSQADVLGYLRGTAPQPEMPVVYGERIDPTQSPPRWRVGVPSDPQRMRFWSDPQPSGAPSQFSTSPMVIALRAPIDAAVSGEDMHLQLLKDVWEMAHATTVNDVIDKTSRAAYIANICFVDRAGRTFSSQLGAIPKRGNDAQLLAAGYRTLDKWAIYSKLQGPVPARHSADRMFDWQFGGFTNPVKPAPLLYLPYPTASPPTGPFKPMTLQDQATNAALPPTSYPATGPFRIESGFFASACNDMIWGYSRKRDYLNWLNTVSFSNVTVDNRLFQWALDHGVVYHTPVLGLEAPDRQQIVVSRFTRQAERIIRGAPAGLPPLTPAQMREFVVTPELYRDDSYVPPAGVTAHPTLPTPIRQLKEVVDHPAFSAVIGQDHYESPMVTAQKELLFFTKLWQALYNGTWSNHVVAGASPSVTLNLRDLWVNGSVPGSPSLQDKIFWYDNPTNPTNPGLRWIDLPPAFPLIDFYWRESELSGNFSGTPGATVVTTGSVDPSGLSPGESGASGTLAALVARLVNWNSGTPHYRNVPSSTGACLLEMMRARYNALSVVTPFTPNSDFGRHWVRLRRGQVEYSQSGWTSLTSLGDLPGGAGLLERESRPWLPLRELAFPGDQLATLMRMGAKVPYDALYNPGTQVVRTTLGPVQTNALVQFFLGLGNFYIDPQANNGNPSRKLARYQLLGGAEATFADRAFPPTYPLTDGLQRLTAVRTLLDTGTYLQTIGPTPPFSQCFRARAYDQTRVIAGQPPGTTGQLWPALPTPDTDCDGGSLRAVHWHDDTSAAGFVPARGFQPRFLGMGGSLATMLALFPSVGQGVDSHFWCTPSIQVMTDSTTRFNAHMNAFATNTLLPTHYDDFLNPAFISQTFVHFY